MPDISRSKTIHGLAWSLFERLGQQGIQFVISIILARLLMPAEFGLIAMLVLFMSLATALLDSGFGSALIQKQDATRVDESSIFYFSIVIGLLLAGLLSFAATWIAAFYNMPVLAPITRWTSLNLIINSFGMVQTALLTKRIDFKTQMKASLVATALAGAAGIVMAYRGYGVWSLVVQSLAVNAFRTGLLWILCPWRPVLAFSIKSLRNMFPFGSMLMLSSILNTFFVNVYLVVIGKLFSPADLGFYSRAQNIQQLPVQNILSTTVGRVIYPVFSALKQDRVRLKRGLSKALSTTALINFPLMVGLAIIARPMVLTLLTDKWLPCVPYLQLICVVGLLYPLQTINLNTVKSQGRSDLYFGIEALNKVFVVFAIVLTYRWGITAMIYGQIVTAAISYLLTGHFSGRLSGYSIREQVRDLLPSLALAAVMGVLIYTLNYTPITNQALLLSLQVVFGIAIYSLMCHYFRIASFREIVEMVKLRLASE